jgi:hypothetical protein
VVAHHTPASVLGVYRCRRGEYLFLNRVPISMSSIDLTGGRKLQQIHEHANAEVLARTAIYWLMWLAAIPYERRHKRRGT